jgi:cellulose synthase/poly-beta-1,6-N-acetylglucosamine synthase-like glycosyltransferase
MLTDSLIFLRLVADLMVIAVGLPVVVLLVEIVAAVAAGRGTPTHRWSGRGAKVAVLVPAHDESEGVGGTIEGIAAQLNIGDRLLVIADNCTDDTAAVAAAAGAEVIERHDPARVGKGYALDCGLRRLEADPPDIVMVIDADCRLGHGTIAKLTATCLATGRPVQALDLMTAPDHSAINHRVAEFAWRVKNWARPLGLHRLGLPCQLMGTGMAFSWSAIRTVDLASGQIVEDLRLGLDLALAGSAPVFCPGAVVTSHFPISAAGAASQRQRWEHGHIYMIWTLAPRLLWLAIVRRQAGLATLVLDMAVPPLTLLALIVAATFFLAGAAAVLGGWYSGFWFATFDLTGFLAAILLSWLRWGRDLLPVASVWSIAYYVVAKLALYRSLLMRGAVGTWVRTDRTK